MPARPISIPVILLAGCLSVLVSCGAPASHRSRRPPGEAPTGPAPVSHTDQQGNPIGTVYSLSRVDGPLEAYLDIGTMRENLSAGSGSVVVTNLGMYYLTPGLKPILLKRRLPKYYEADAIDDRYAVTTVDGRFVQVAGLPTDRPIASFDLESLVGPKPRPSLFFVDRDHIAVEFAGGIAMLSIPQRRILWSDKTPAKGTGSIIAFGRGADNIAPAVGFLKDVYGINEKTGHYEWKFSTPESLLELMIHLSGGLALLNYAPNMVASINMKTGKPLWTFQVPHGEYVGEYVRPVRFGSDLFVNGSNHTLYCLTLVRGEIRWAMKFNGFLYAAPVVNGEFVFEGDANGRLAAFDINSADEIWNRQLPAAISDISAWGNYLAISVKGRGVWIVDARSGKTARIVRLTTGAVFFRAGGSLYFSSTRILFSFM